MKLSFSTFPSSSVVVVVVVVIAFDRTHTIYFVFQSRGFYHVPRGLIADTKSFQAFAAILD